MCKVEHTQKCQERTAVIQAAIEAYDKQWPHYCRTCMGFGAVSYTENLGPWGEVWLYDGWEYCEKCICVCICPRCGVKDEDSFDLDKNASPKCLNCGWNEETTPRPELDICSCIEDAMYDDYYKEHDYAY